MLNLERLERARAFVASGGDDKREWDQSDWYQSPDSDCKTKCCVAGFAALDAGYTPGTFKDYVATPKGDVFLSWEHAGVLALGITWSDADIFDGDQTREELLARLDELIEQAKHELS